MYVIRYGRCNWYLYLMDVRKTSSMRWCVDYVGILCQSRIRFNCVNGYSNSLNLCLMNIWKSFIWIRDNCIKDENHLKVRRDICDKNHKRFTIFSVVYVLKHKNALNKAAEIDVCVWLLCGINHSVIVEIWSLCVYV